MTTTNSPASQHDPQGRVLSPSNSELEELPTLSGQALSSVRGVFGLGGDRLVLSVAEAGELLGISRAFAYELVARGELPVVRFGRRIVVPKAALLELLGAATSER
jgi:excisionase family DNA binding protein